MYLVVVYKESKKSKEKISIFTENTLDDLLSISKRKPLLPYEYEIVYVGVGEAFKDRFIQEYSISYKEKDK